MLLVKVVSPGVFQSTFGPVGGSWEAPAGPGMEVGVTMQDMGSDADVYQIVLKPSSDAGQIDTRVCSLEDGTEYWRVLASGRERQSFVVKQPQAEASSLVVSWVYSGHDFSKHIFLPRSLSVSEAPYLTIRNGKVDDALRVIASAYGAAVISDAGLEGSVTLSGKFENAKAALDVVADQIGREVRREGSRAYRLEPK